MKVKKEHLDRLTRGKRSGASLGSRKVPHRLTQEERGIFERAKKAGYLSVASPHRPNLSNVWEKYCEIADLPDLVLRRIEAGCALVLSGGIEVFSGTLLEAKSFVAKTIEEGRTKTVLRRSLA